MIKRMSNIEKKQLAEGLANLIPMFHQKFIHQVDFPVPPNHFLTLIRLHAYGTQTITELSTRLLISKQQMSPIVDKLSSAGYLERHQDPCDRRSTRLSITSKGFDVLQQHHDNMVANLEEKLLSLNEAETQAFERTLESFVHLFNKLP